MMTKTWFDEVAEESEAKGRQKEQRRLIQRLLESKFGPLNPGVVQRLETLSAERLDEIALAILRANTLDELGLGDTPLNGHNGT